MRNSQKLALLILVVLGLANNVRGQGGQGLATFRQGLPEATPTRPSESGQEPREPEPWGPVSSPYTSLVNTIPGLLPYFNNGPVFGLSGTALGDLRSRTQLTGDWGGLRTDLAARGLFIDLYTTGVYQRVTSGGVKAWSRASVSRTSTQ